MQVLFNKMHFLIGTEDHLSRFEQIRPLEIFSPVVLDFWGEVSTRLLKDHRSKQYPDVVTFAFFCRKAHLLSLKESYVDAAVRLGRGVVFHIAPSNVPVNFAYSLLVGMLAGNSNVVRISSKDFPQVDLICQAVANSLQSDKFATLNERVCVVRYPRGLENNEVLTSLADVRVIWGGDATISEVRRAQLSPKAYDVCFADRYSMALFNAEAVLSLQDVHGLAKKFYNDTYLLDQNACSTPRLVVWYGEPVSILTAQKMFWEAVNFELENYSIDAVAVVDKLTTICEHAGDFSGPHLMPRVDNKLWRVELDSLHSDLTKHRCASGYFLEFATNNLNDLKDVVNRKYQTLSYFGFDKTQIEELARKSRFLGLDRIVPVGQTLDFSMTWDGYDLIRSLSRVCEVL